MRASFATSFILTGALLAGGCATKKYVRNTTAPIQAKVDQVGEQSNQNTQQIAQTNQQVKDVDERAQSGINAVSEKASTADQHAMDAISRATDAMGRATVADGKGDRNATEIASLRESVANLDDYKLQTATTVGFGFDKYRLNDDARQELDKLATGVALGKRFFIAVEGYTDAAGSREYNEVLSRRRADSVVEYLVAKHDIPIYRIHMVGLGPEKPVDEAHGLDARAKNRRVEVKVFSATPITAAMPPSADAPSTTARSQN